MSLVDPCIYLREVERQPNLKRDDVSDIAALTGHVSQCRVSNLRPSLGANHDLGRPVILRDCQPIQNSANVCVDRP
jgi:hypothetical protein